MTELIVKDINSDWSISFDFSTTATTMSTSPHDFKSMTVGKLKKEIYNANNIYAIEKQKLIFMGTILNHDEVELRNLISNNERVCFHLIASTEMKTNSSNLSDAHSSNEKTLVSSIVVDAISLRSASEWLSKYTNTNNKIVKTEHFNHLQSLYEVLQEVKVANPSSTDSNNQRGGRSSPTVGDAAAQPAAPAEREFEPIVWINMSLMAKLVAVAAFFIYNKNLLHRVDQLLCIAVTMVFFYLAHIGAIYRAFQLICRYLNLMPPRAAPVPPIHAGQPQLQQPQNQPQDRRRESFGSILTELLQHGVTIPTSPGVLNDLFSMAAGALCSLYPQWKPVAVAVAIHPAL